jgi:hypothetical protein
MSKLKAPIANCEPRIMGKAANIIVPNGVSSPVALDANGHDRPSRLYGNRAEGNGDVVAGPLVHVFSGPCSCPRKGAFETLLPYATRSAVASLAPMRRCILRLDFLHKLARCERTSIVRSRPSSPRRWRGDSARIPIFRVRARAAPGRRG